MLRVLKPRLEQERATASPRHPMINRTDHHNHPMSNMLSNETYLMIQGQDADIRHSTTFVQIKTICCLGYRILKHCQQEYRKNQVCPIESRKQFKFILCFFQGNYRPRIFLYAISNRL